MVRVLSGIQPSGNLHLGNYLGCIKSWLKLQKDFGSLFFFIADLHSITVFQDPHALKQAIFDSIAVYIACGIDVEKSVIFTQSSISAHAELCWLLSCITPVGWLNRMTQFKDKIAQSKSLGLYSYPVLMAADILLYKATHIPVGDDQTQHLELTRDIAKTFNTLYATDYFFLPEIIKPNINARVMSLKDGSVKMSKSDPSDYSRINLSDSPDLISKKISKAKTDSIVGFNIKTLPNRPEVYNLIKIYAELSNMTVESVCDQVDNCAMLKKKLTDILVSSLDSIYSEFLRLQKDQSYLHMLIKKGQEMVSKIAFDNLHEVKSIMGIYN